MCEAAAEKANKMGSECTYAVESCDCFPGTATVQLKDGRTILMRDLVVGDTVLTGPGGQYSEVYLFSHRLADTTATYVQLKTASAALLQLSKRHYVYVNGDRLVEAQSVKVGDNVTLGALGEATTVIAVGLARNEGLYNPHTLQGNIVVDGILASTYTAAFPPALAHAVLAPLRALYCAGVDIFKVDVGSALDVLPAWWTRRFHGEENA